MSNILAIAAARSVDLKLQAWAADQTAQQLWTRWKESPAESAAWTPWQLFPYPLTVAGSTVDIQYLFAGQLALQGKGAFPIPRGTDAPVPGAGSMQLWAILQATDSSGNQTNHIYTTVKSAEQVNATWEPWKKFDANLVTANPAQSMLSEGSVVSLPDGRLQVWALMFNPESPTNETTTLWTTVQTIPKLPASYTGTQGWSPWRNCTQQLPAGWTISGDPTACQLPDGSTQLWVIGYNENNGTYNFAVLGSNLSSGADPLTGWTAWSVFKPVPLQAGIEIQALRAVTDGNGRAYLWYSYAGVLVGNAYPISWYYIYTETQAPAAAVNWSQPFLLPLPSALFGDSSIIYDNRVITLAVLPNKGLQLFLLDTKLQTGNKIETSWQMPPLPKNWYQGGSLPGGWTDFSVT
jgi:hypothetical protein